MFINPIKIIYNPEIKQKLIVKEREKEKKKVKQIERFSNIDLRA